MSSRINIQCQSLCLDRHKSRSEQKINIYIEISFRFITCKRKIYPQMGKKTTFFVYISLESNPSAIPFVSVVEPPLVIPRFPRFYYTQLNQFSSIRLETWQIDSKSLVFRVTRIRLLAIAMLAICKSNSWGILPNPSSLG